MTYARVDTNHKEIVKALRDAGATVVSLAAMKHGCPDLLVGYAGETLLMEIKKDAK
jgi:Holliday junction resolvase